MIQTNIISYCTFRVRCLKCKGALWNSCAVLFVLADSGSKMRLANPQSSSIKHYKQIVQRLVQATKRDGENLVSSCYYLLTYGQ